MFKRRSIFSLMSGWVQVLTIVAFLAALALMSNWTWGAMVNGMEPGLVQSGLVPASLNIWQIICLFFSMFLAISSIKFLTNIIADMFDKDKSLTERFLILVIGIFIFAAVLCLCYWIEVSNVFPKMIEKGYYAASLGYGNALVISILITIVLFITILAAALFAE